MVENLEKTLQNWEINYKNEEKDGKKKKKKRGRKSKQNKQCGVNKNSIE